jgi:glucokinase
MILAGDIGGTKTNLALFESGDRDFRTAAASATYPSQKYESLERILDEFLGAHPAEVECAAFGIAGAVVGGRVETPNLPWKVLDEDLASKLGVERVRLVNDLVATAFGILSLGPEQLHTLHEGERQESGNIAVIAAGTGCGMAFLLRQGDRLVPIGSEGGHVDFAPRSALEIGLIEFLRKRFGRVSYDRVLSGPGLYNIYSYLRESRYADEPEWLAAEIASGDPGAAISKAALAGRSELAMKALDMFASVYGAMAGNLALMVLATRGVFIGGGIAPKILDKLGDGTFLEAFRQKGRLTPLMQKMPVRVILDPKAALYGAARVATEST